MGDGLNADGLGFRENIFGNVGSETNPTPENHTEKLFTPSTAPDYAVFQSNGEWIAISPSAEIASGSDLATVIQAAENDAGKHDIVEVHADGGTITGGPIEITRQNPRYYQFGKLTLQSDYMTIGGANASLADDGSGDNKVMDSEIRIGQIEGQGNSDGNSVITLDAAFGGKLKYGGEVSDVSQILKAHGLNGVVADWDVQLPSHSIGHDVAMEYHAENNDVEGFNHYGGYIFATTKTCYKHDTNKAGGVDALSNIDYYGTSFHGSTASRNTHEIHEVGIAERHKYFLNYLGNPTWHAPSATGQGQVVLADPTCELYYANEFANGLLLNDFGGFYTKIRDSGGTLRNVHQEVGTDGVETQALNSAPGANAGLWRVTADGEFEVRGSGGDLKLKVDSANDQVDFAGAVIREISEASSTSDPTTDAPQGFLQALDLGGSEIRIPYYSP